MIALVAVGATVLLAVACCLAAFAISGREEPPRVIQISKVERGPDGSVTYHTEDKQ